MAKERRGLFSNKNLSILLLLAIAVQFAIPRIGIRGLDWIATALVLFVAIILLIKK